LSHATRHGLTRAALFPTQTCQKGTSPAASIPPDRVQNAHGSSDWGSERIACDGLYRRQIAANGTLDHAHDIAHVTIKVERGPFWRRCRRIMTSQEPTLARRGLPRLAVARRTARAFGRCFINSLTQSFATTAWPIVATAAGRARGSTKCRQKLPEKRQGKARMPYAGRGWK
jgi:hypothetical protein